MQTVPLGGRYFLNAVEFFSEEAAKRPAADAAERTEAGGKKKEGERKMRGGREKGEAREQARGGEGREGKAEGAGKRERRQGAGRKEEEESSKGSNYNAWMCFLGITSLTYSELLQSTT